VFLETVTSPIVSIAEGRSNEFVVTLVVKKGEILSLVVVFKTINSVPRSVSYCELTARRASRGKRTSASRPPSLELRRSEEGLKSERFQWQMPG
jgi:hypothetical protein